MVLKQLDSIQANQSDFSSQLNLLTTDVAVIQRDVAHLTERVSKVNGFSIDIDKELDCIAQDVNTFKNFYQQCQKFKWIIIGGFVTLFMGVVSAVIISVAV